MTYNHIDDVRILPWNVTLTGGKVERHNAATQRKAELKALAGKSRYCRVLSCVAVVATFGS